jgi:glycosyltransferase involved in cell wall biosynthesis
MFGSDLDAPTQVSAVMVPHDRAQSFADCDGWILFGNTSLGATAWLRPAIVIAPQLAERYVPAFAGQKDVDSRIDTFLAWRRARAVLGGTVADRQDLVSFAGVHPSLVRPLPPLCNVLSSGRQGVSATDDPAIIWHPAFPWPAPARTAAAAWREYLDSGGTLPLLIVGRYADTVASIPAVSSLLDECSRIGGRWQTRVILPGRRLDRVLDRARILWNPSVADDGNWLISRALARGIPAVVADAPHFREILDGEAASISLLWPYAAHDIVAAAAALLAASTAPLGEGSQSALLRPVTALTGSWCETLALLRGAYDD